VEKKYTGTFPSQVTRFKTRRVNFTFRFVPPQDIVPYSNLPAKAAEDVEEYMKELAKNSRFFARALKARGRK
jgi:hypothetical protein